MGRPDPVPAAAQEPATGLRIVLAHGCFDLLHLGHIRHLQEAKRLGDYLIVSVTSDKHVSKGLGRPHFNAEQRAEALRALDCVNEVVINDDADAAEMIQRVRPAIYVKGIDYKGRMDGRFKKEADAVEAVGGKVYFTTTRKWSSSNLINIDKFSDDVLKYLERCKISRFRDQILGAFDRADKLKITFIGETIIDEYRYVRGLGRASKELMLATVETGHESFMGGVQAAALHADWSNTSVLTSAEVVRKTRLVDQDFNRKLFDIYSTQRIAPNVRKREELRELMRGAVAKSDVIIAFDFGHGMLTEVERSLLSTSRFFAVNAQTNAGNYGFNPITKYKDADFVCIDEPEARLAVSMDHANLSDVVQRLSDRVKCGRWVITRGRNGSAFSRGMEISEAPAFLHNGIDTMGAGDAALAVMAPLVASGLDLGPAAFVGNVVGAIKTTIIGHRRHVNRQEIVQTVEALLS